MSEKVVTTKLIAYYWLDYRKFGANYLAKEHIDALDSANALDECELTVSVELVAPPKTDEKALAAAVKEFDKKGMATVRAQAGKAFATIAQAFMDDGGDQDAKLKKAQSAFKSLDDFVDKYVFSHLGGELRRFVAKEIDIKPDDLTSLNASKYKLRLNPDVFGFDSGADDADDAKKEKLLKSIKRVEKHKGTWLHCCVIWEDNDKIATLVAKPKFDIKKEEITLGRQALKFSFPGFKNRGLVMLKQTKWIYQFIDGRLPPDSKLKEGMKELLEKSGLSVEVRWVKDYDLSGGENGTTIGIKPTESSKEQSKEKDKGKEKEQEKGKNAKPKAKVNKGPGK